MNSEHPNPNNRTQTDLLHSERTQSYLERLKEAIAFQSHDEFTEQDQSRFDKTSDLVIEAAKAYVELLESQDYKILPVEPTIDMCNEVKSPLLGNVDAMRLYAMMLAAAPPYNPENSK